MPPQTMPDVAQQKIPTYTPSVIVIDNMATLGLSRRAHGKLQSGYAKYLTTWGIDPFSKPGALSWQENLTTIDAAHATLLDLIVDMKVRVESGIGYCYAVDYAGNGYKITISNNAVSVIITTSGLNLKYGGGLEIFKITTDQLCVGTDAGLSHFNMDGTGATAITAGVTWVANVPRPLRVWGASLYAANGSALVQIGTGGAVTSSDILNSSIPPQYTIIDTALSADGTYLKLLCTTSTPADLKTTDPKTISADIPTYVFYWNGTDSITTSLTAYPSFSGTSVHTFGQTALLFGQDYLGASIGDENQKIASLTVTNSPRKGCTDSSGDLGLFAARDYINAKQNVSIFAVGTPDAMTQTGVWRLHLAAATSPQTDVNTVGAFKVVQNTTYPTSVTGGPTLTDSKFYVSTYEIKTGGNSYELYTGTLTPRGVATPMLGVYETETEFFPQRFQFTVLRVYCDPTAANEGFQLDLVDSAGNVISGASGFTYTYATGTDPTQVQGSLTEIEFLCQPNAVQAASVRLTNTGTVAMAIHKVELEYISVDK